MSIINDVLVDKLFKDPPKRTKEIPLLSEKTVSGDGMVVINDAYSDFPIKNLTLQGNTKQDSTTGKNLFSSNYDEYTLPLNYYIYPLILNKGETYTVSIKSVSKIQNIVINILRNGSAYPFENTEIVDVLLNLNDSLGDRKKTFTVDETFTAPAIAIYAESKESFNSIFEAKEIQLEKGSIATSYEPYTGGKPSPSPDYPQEIKNVGKWNEETQKYEVDVKVTGKNIFNTKSKKLLFTYCILQEDGSVKSNVTNNYFCFINITDPKILDSIKNGQTITFSTDKGIPNKTLTILISDGNRNQEKNSSAGESSVTMTVSGIGKVKKLELRFNRSSTRFTDKETIVKDLMLCFGESTEYQPYKEQAITFQMPNGLLGIPVKSGGNYTDATGQQRICDEIDFERGKYVQRVWSKMFTGSDDERWTAYNTSPYEGFTITILPEEMDKRAGFCNLLIVKEKVENVESIVFGISSNNIYCIASSLYDSSLEDKGIANWKAHLSKTPMEVMTYLTTPIEYDLSSEEIEKYKALYTYYPTTVVTVDGGELPVGIEVTYMHPEYIPTKQSALRMWFKENPII